MGEWAITLLGEVFGRRKEPKAEQNIVVRSRVLRNNCLEGLFHTVPSSFVLRCLFLEWTNSRWIACALGNVSRKHQRFTTVPPSLTYKDPKIEGLFRRSRCHLLGHWLGMKFLADNTLAEKRANYLPDLWNPKLLAHFRNDMFTPKATDQLMGVVNHRSRSSDL